MKKGILLHSELSAVIATMVHTDTLCIGDCGLPIPEGTKRIDLCLKKGVPDFLQTLDTVLLELCVEKVTIATEMVQKNVELYHAMQNKFDGVEIELVPHEKLKEMTGACRAVVRTGEYKPYANIILHSGVTFQ